MYGNSLEFVWVQKRPSEVSYMAFNFTIIDFKDFKPSSLFFSKAKRK